MGLRTFSGAVAIVTGGASGIGRALAEELASRGCEVVVADLQIDLAKEVINTINKRGGKANFTELDVVDFIAVEKLVNETTERYGRLDYMFNNAGIGIGGEVKDHKIEDWDRIIDVNFRGVTNGIQAAYQVMVEQGFGHIVNTSSIAGLAPAAYASAYSATKHGIVGLSTSLRAEASFHGIRVSVLCPGVIRTPILDGGKYGKFLLDISKENLMKNWNRLFPMDPIKFAGKAINKVKRNKAIIILPSWWKLVWLLNRLSPSLAVFTAKMSIRNMRKQLNN